MYVFTTEHELYNVAYCWDGPACALVQQFSVLRYDVYKYKGIVHFGIMRKQ